MDFIKKYSPSLKQVLIGVSIAGSLIAAGKILRTNRRYDRPQYALNMEEVFRPEEPRRINMMEGNDFAPRINKQPIRFMK